MRHAWLILAHNQFPMLKKLIAFLDGEDSGIFLHIDQKAADAPLGELAAAAKVSPVRFVERRSISWGDFSMVEAELDLLRAAVSEGCDRFHLLSGVDAPIKSRGYIRSFFEEHPETNFINFQQPVIGEHELWRVRFYYPFQRRNRNQRFPDGQADPGCRPDAGRCCQALDRPAVPENDPGAQE